MLRNEGDSLDYLLAYRQGKIKKGLEIGCDLDNFHRLKKNHVNIIMGHDNVGKTHFVVWFLLCHAIINGVKSCIWSGENQKGQILRNLIQMYKGVHFMNLSESEIMSAASYLEQYFVFVDNKRLYQPKELFSIFKAAKCDVALIDPFTGLDRDMSYVGNYQFLNEARQFVNQEDITLYINTHPSTASGRRQAVYPAGDLAGHLQPPFKDDVEGGKAFSNRCDDFIVLHRLPKHPTLRNSTWVITEKIKDVDTGGQVMNIDEPLYAGFNYGCGYNINGINPIRQHFDTDKYNTKIDKISEEEPPF